MNKLNIMYTNIEKKPNSFAAFIRLDIPSDKAIFIEKHFN